MELAARLPLPRASAGLVLQPSASCVGFAQEPSFVTFQLVDSPPMHFDQRLLVARSEYCRKMFEKSCWKEATTRIIDLSSDMHAGRRSTAAVLSFLIFGRYSAEGDAESAFAVRRLADRFCLPELVSQAERELQGLPRAGNVLAFLDHGTGTNGPLEQACIDMLQVHDCELLEEQVDRLDEIVAENQELARQLCRLLLGNRRKRQRVT